MHSECLNLHVRLLITLDCSWPIVSNRSSCAYDLSSYEAQRILSLVREQDPPQPQSIHRSQTSISLANPRPDPMTRRRASMFVQPQSAPISRSTSEVSLHPPMRRRSMVQTPGVATRPCPPPASAKSRRSSMRHSLPPTPSISRQPSTRFEESTKALDKHLSLPLLSPSFGASNDLSSTPTSKDLDYSITGAFKFGTLRITNGSPVLAPSPGPSYEAAQPELANTAKDHSVVEVQREIDTTICAAESAQLEAQVLAPDPAGCLNTRLKSGDDDLQPVLAVVVSDQNLEPHVSEPLLDVDMIQHRPTSWLMTQSRQAAVDDHLFDDDDDVSVPEILDVRVDLNARSFPVESADYAQAPAGVNRSDSGFVSKSSSSQSRKSLAKADSGYSSTISVRSLRSGNKMSISEEQMARSLTDDERTLPKGQCTVAQRQLDMQVPGPMAAVRDHSMVTSPSDIASTPPPKQDLSPKQMFRMPRRTDSTRATSSTPGTEHEQALQHRPSSIDTSQRQELTSSKSLPHTPTSTASDESASSLTIGNNTQKPGRLQRLLSLRNSPFSKQPYTVHVTHSVDSQIPSIPQDVEAKLRERTGLYPMTNKRLALKSPKSKDTLKTILSVGSLEYTNDDHPAHTPTRLEREVKEDQQDDSTEAPENSLKQTFSSMQSNFKTAAAFMLSNRKQIARKPLPMRGPQQPGFDVSGKEKNMSHGQGHLTNYLSMNSALGSDAHDSATRALTPATRPGRTMSMTTYHDHYSQSPKRRTSPPISMVTRSGFRAPPPRSPVNPQGPAVLPGKSREKSSRPMSHSAAMAAGHRLGRVPGDSRPRRSASTSQIPANMWNPSSRHNSPGAQPQSLVHTRHDSMSSACGNIARDPWMHQTYGQRTSAVSLKQRYSLEKVGKAQHHGNHVPHPAHQGPAPDLSVPPSHHNLSTPTSHPTNGSQERWAAPSRVHRGQHNRNFSTGSSPYHPHPSRAGGQPPYRILHSYNSPAYRNAPIWG